MLFRTKTKIRRFLNKLFKTHKPTSYPFISGDSFRALSQHIYDEYFDIDINRIQKNDIIFVKGNLLLDFFNKVHKKIKNSYILISHNDDTNITKVYEKFLDDKIIHWFAQNLCFENKKITPIPIGLKNLNAYKTEETHSLNLSSQAIKENKIAYGFNTESNEERLKLLEILKKQPLSQKIEEKDQISYYYKLNGFKFVVSPEGRGIDCHRTWEAIYLKTVPILIKGPMSEYFKKIGLPILIINSWDELNSLNEESLRNEYEKIYKNYSTEPVFIDYWLREIIKIKND